MGSRAAKNPGGDMVHRSRAIVGLLVASVLLVVALAWQAQQASRKNYETVSGVLKDYAMLVADEFARRAMGDVGYYGYYTYINSLRQQAVESSDYPFEASLPDPESPGFRAAELAAYLFFVDRIDGAIRWVGETRPGTALVEHIEKRSAIFLSEPMPETGFLIDHAVIANEAHTFILTRMENSERVFGFEVDREQLSARLGQAFGKAALLPPSLAGGAITNEFLYLRFVDETGKTLFDTGDNYDPSLLASRQLQDEYSGIFRGYTINAAIDPAIGESLVIGGLPVSRLPFLILVMVLTVGLLLAAIRQLQRERAVMQLRSDFVSEVSHELRTPLTQIRMFAETLLLGRVRTDADRRRALEIINREAQRLINLVENVLQFSDQNRGGRPLRLERGMLAPLVESTVSEFRSLADGVDAEIRLRLEGGAEAKFDKHAVKQMLLNMLDNAIKYGPAGQQVIVSLTTLPGRIRLSVADQGPGVPTDKWDRVWESYYRLDRERTSAIAGTGIGLAVVRELAESHHGRAWVEDSESGGALFVVELPAGTESKSLTGSAAGEAG